MPLKKEFLGNDMTLLGHENNLTAAPKIERVLEAELLC